MIAGIDLDSGKFISRFKRRRNAAVDRPVRNLRSYVLAAAFAQAIMLAPIQAQAAAGGKDAFPVRGVVHGAFGPVWTHAERMDMIRWVATHGMNTFLYMPNEDPYARERWNQPYPDATMAEFSEEIRLAYSLGVKWGFGSRQGQPLFMDEPGRGICFTCDSDFEVLAAKYQRFHDLGVRVLMLAVDDAAKASSHPEDIEKFGVGDHAYGRMNAYLANRLQARFADSLVIIGPAEYSGTSGSDYLTGLGEALSEQIVVAWTGPFVFSGSITAGDADAYAAALSPAAGPRRRLLIWDNYPVNDVYGEAFSAVLAVRELNTGLPERAPSLRLNFGPLKGRGADLVGHVEGYLSNGMNQPQASKLALYTIAAYANDPLAYTPDQVSCPYNASERTRAGCLAEAAWLEGIRELGGKAAGPLLDVVNQMRSTIFDRTEAPVFVARRDAFIAAFSQPSWGSAWSALVGELRAEQDGGRSLQALKLPSPEFIEETANHLATLELNTQAGLLAAEMLRAQRPDVSDVILDRRGSTALVRGRVSRASPTTALAAQSDLARVEVLVRASPFVVHGDRVISPFEVAVGGQDPFVLQNRMDQFLDWAHEATNAWLPVSGLAAAGPLQVTANGVPASVKVDGTFAATVTLKPGQKDIELIVTDAAGYKTARTFKAKG